VKEKLDSLFEGLEKGDKKSASQLMSIIEDEGPESEAALKRLYTIEAKALVIGVTGWPGVGKSSLINHIAKAFLSKGKRVGIVAVDPTSPFSGGSLLGDRIRFKDIEGKEHLFIRSMATRGYHGGLSRAARAFVKVMEVLGSELVLLETVGIGQDQITISFIADTTLVVVAPGLGDYLQAMKSGILEAGDIFVVNKADRSDADRAVLDLETAIRITQKEDWRPPVVKTVAVDGTGIDTLIQEINRHALHRLAEQSVLSKKIRAAGEEIKEAVKSRLFDYYYGREDLGDKPMARYAHEICERHSDPYIVADILLVQKGIVQTMKD
jgi:LAO/AO transport system kinase